MKIEFDTEVDDRETVLAVVSAAYPASRAAPAPAAVADSPQPDMADDVLPGGWTESKLRRWASWLQPDAAECVRFIAAHAPSVAFDDLLEHFGRYRGIDGPADGRLVGGVMSSGGHAANSIVGVRSQPIDRDYMRRRYVIDPRVARILASALGPPAEV